MQWQHSRWGGSNRAIISRFLDGEEFRCVLCRGKGVLHSGKAQCPVCGGRGLVKVTPPAMICSYCSGRGDVPARSGITCAVCGGKGLITVRQPVEVCPGCRGTGASFNSKLSCLSCRGKGVVTARQYTEATGKGRREHAEKAQFQRETEPSPIFLQQVPLFAQGREMEAARTAAYIAPTQRKSETMTVSAGVVAGLVRRLMVTERRRILRNEGINLDRYALEKRTQRWRESTKPFRQSGL